MAGWLSAWAGEGLLVCVDPSSLEDCEARDGDLRCGDQHSRQPTNLFATLDEDLTTLQGLAGMTTRQ